jgi:hypothetical protein
MNKGLYTFLPEIGSNLLGLLYLALWIIHLVVLVSIPWPGRWFGAVFALAGYVALIVADIVWRLREKGMGVVGRLLWPGKGGMISLCPAWLWLLAMPLVLLCEYWLRQSS